MSCQQHSCTGCGGSCCAGCHQKNGLTLRRSEADFLLRFAVLPFLPVVRFSLRRFGTPAQTGDSLAPAFLQSPADSLETIQHTAQIIQRLEQMNLISIKYTEPLGHFNYAEYVNSCAFTEFCSAASGFTVPEIEYGSMALTAAGQEAIDDLELVSLPSGF